MLFEVTLQSTNNPLDVAFEVDDLDSIYASIVKRGAQVVTPPQTLSDEYGTVKTATIRTYGETTHTLVEKSQYKGPFLPGYRVVNAEDPLSKLLPQVHLENIDHCVGNMD